MARGKKAAKELTPEETLKQALVPAEEQPYAIPANWLWCRVASICDFERGITFPASAKEYELTETNIPCLRTANIQEELGLQSWMKRKKKHSLLQMGSSCASLPFCIRLLLVNLQKSGEKRMALR